MIRLTGITIDPDDVPDRQELDQLHRWVMAGVRGATLSDPGATIADAPHSTGRSTQ